MEGTPHPGEPSPTPPCWDPPFGGSLANKRGSPRCRRGVAPSPSPPSSPSPGCVGLGAEQLFWRLPDNSALYLPPVPPNTLVSAAALCCKFPWSNYVLIYDNPGRAVEGGQAPVKFGSCPPGPGGPPWLLPTVNSSLDHELLHPGGWGEHPRASPGRERGCSRGRQRVEATWGWELVSVCRAGVSPAPWLVCPIPPPIRELGIIPGSSWGEAGMLCACPSRQGGNLSLPRAPGTAPAWGRTLPPSRR